MSSTKFVFFGPIRKTRWPLQPLIGWDIFDFSSATAEQNSTKLDMKQDKPSLCFSGRSEKQDGCPGLWLFETFSTSSLKPLNRIQRNLTGSKTSTSSTKFVLFGPIGKTRWPLQPLIGWDIFDFFLETAEQNSTKLDKKQDLNVLYQVCVFWADRKNKMTAATSDWLRHFRLLLWNRWTEFNETWQEARYQCLLPSLCFSGRSKNQDGHCNLWLAETFSTSSLKPLNRIQQNLTRSKISTSSTKFVFFWADRKNKMTTATSDWLRHFRLLLWNRWTEFNETWMEARYQCLLPSLCFWGRWVNKNCHPGWSVKKVAQCTQVHDMLPFGPLVIVFRWRKALCVTEEIKVIERYIKCCCMGKRPIITAFQGFSQEIFKTHR